MTKTTRIPIEFVVVKWSGADVYARAILADGTHIDGKVLYTNEESNRIRNFALGHLRRELKAAGYSADDIRVAFKAATVEDEEAL